MGMFAVCCCGRHKGTAANLAWGYAESDGRGNLAKQKAATR
jgi:hypothetical protein